MRAGSHPTVIGHLEVPSPQPATWPRDLKRLATESDSYSGADLAQLCAVATRMALADAAATGKVRPVMMADLDQARKQVKSTTGEWLATPRNAATFANLDGTYDELDEYLKRWRR